jgi:SNF2 family DNA or RNA helicase
MPVLTLDGQPTVEEFLAVKDPKLTVEALDPPEGCEPYDYQKVDAAFAIMRKRCVIAEYPAAGKKLIAILGALKLIELGKIEHVLVVSLGTDVDQWVEEVDEWTTGISIEPHRGEKKKRLRRLESDYLPDMMTCSYQTAAADIGTLLNKFDLIILDEVSFIKTPKTEPKSIAPRLRALCAPTRGEQVEFFRLSEMMLKHANVNPVEYIWGLSATPLETGPMDLFSLFWTIHGKESPLGTSPERYKMMHCEVKRMKVRSRYWDPGEKRMKVKRIQVEKILGANKDNLPALKTAIRPWWIRHPWEVVAKHLPPLEVEPIWLDLSKVQRERYIEISNGNLVYDFFKQSKGYDAPHTKEVEYALKHLYQLRCCDGMTSLPNQKRKESVKLTKCMELITGELGAEKIIVFSRFHQPLNDVADRLDEYGISWARIDGNHDELENTRARLEFERKDGPRILLITSKAGYALNLQTAHYGIAFNTLYNPKKVEQLWGRNRRRQKGVPTHEQTTVIWYHLLCKMTVEEAQWHVLRERAEESADIFGDEEDFFKILTPEEQEALTHYGYGSHDYALVG